MSDVVPVNGEDQGNIPVIYAPEYKERLRLKSVNKIKEIPMVDCTLDVTNKVYRTIKKSTCITNFFFKKIENIVLNVEDKIMRPIILKIRRPIRWIDDKIYHSLEFVESKVPCVKQHPKEILSDTGKCLKKTYCAKGARRVLSVCKTTEKKKLGVSFNIEASN